MRKNTEREGTETVRTVEVVQDVSAATAADGRLVRRAEASKLLNVSVSTLRRMDPLLEPVVDENGVHLYDPVKLEKVRTSVRQTVTTRTRDPLGIDGEMAADVFDLFEQGLGPVDVVRRLRLHPTSVETLHAQWARMNGGVVIDETQLATLQDVLIEHCTPKPVRTGRDVVENVQRMVAALEHASALEYHRSR